MSKVWETGETITAEDLNALQTTADEAKAQAEATKTALANLKKALGIKGQVSAKGFTEAQLKAVREILGV
jgi:hypothetical protein